MYRMEHCSESIMSLDKASIVEIKSMAKPPEAVRGVITCLVHLFKLEIIYQKPKIGQKKQADYWQTAKTYLFKEPKKLIQMMLEFDKDHISKKTLTKVKQLTKDFTVPMIAKVSRAASVLFEWVECISDYKEQKLKK